MQGSQNKTDLRHSAVIISCIQSDIDETLKSINKTTEHEQEAT